MSQDDERTITVTERPEVPWLAVLFGYGPMLPFVAGAALAWWRRDALGETAAHLTLLWGCAVLLFLSGVRRGLSFRTAGGETAMQVATMLGLFGLGLAALLAESAGRPALAAILLIAGYGAIALLDPVAARRGEAPLFFVRLRPMQMPLALLGLAALLALKLQA